MKTNRAAMVTVSMAVSLWAVSIATCRSKDGPPYPLADQVEDVAPAGQEDSQSTGAQSGYQTLMRGPVHEAFARPIMYDPETGIVVPTAPPDDIKEVPPAEKPKGADVVWIPGYWGWDANKDDFVWVSGIWRVPPQDREWMPGYWSKADKGHQWVSGYWAPTNAETTTLTEPPPKSLENGPSSPWPGGDHVWIPGHWEFVNSEFVWVPGYWSQGRSDLVWVPAQYVPTPASYVFVDGYWDYPVGVRGLLFAPVYYTRPVYVEPDYCYTPCVVIDDGFLCDNLFSYREYCHYYFGDYYSPLWFSCGIVPCFSNTFRWHGYSEVFDHQCFLNGHDLGGFIDGCHNRYRRLRGDHRLRPHHTFEGTRDRGDRREAGRAGGPGHRNARRLREVLADRDFTERFARRSREGVASASRENAVDQTLRTARTEAARNTQRARRDSPQSERSIRADNALRRQFNLHLSTFRDGDTAADNDRSFERRTSPRTNAVPRSGTSGLSSPRYQQRSDTSSRVRDSRASYRGSARSQSRSIGDNVVRSSPLASSRSYGDVSRRSSRASDSRSYRDSTSRSSRSSSSRSYSGSRSSSYGGTRSSSSGTSGRAYSSSGQSASSVRSGSAGSRGYSGSSRGSSSARSGSYGGSGRSSSSSGRSTGSSRGSGGGRR